MAVILVLIATALAICYYMARRNFKFWANTGVKCLNPPTFLGAIRGTFFVDTVELYTFAPEEPYIGIATLSSPVISIRDPDLIKAVLSNESKCFLDRGFKKFNEKWDPMSVNLFLVDGQKWKYLREKLTPAFTSLKLRGLFVLTKDVVDRMVRIVSSCAEKSEAVDMSYLAKRCTADITFSIAFGVEGNAMTDPDNVFCQILRRHFKITSFKSFFFNLLIAFPWLAYIIPPERGQRELKDIFLKPFLDTLKERKLNGVRRNDYVDFLLDIQKKEIASIKPEEKLQFTDQVIAASLWGFFLAGSESTGNTVAFATVELAHNIDIQNRVREEVKESMERFGGLTYDAINNMTYLEQVIHETLRLYPTVTLLKRMVSKAYTMPDGRVTLPAGSRVSINIRLLHRDPRYYPEPERFDPERFTPEAKLERHRYTFLAFGEGPRICTGVRLAMIESKLILASLVSQFEIRPKEGIPYPPVLAIKTTNQSLLHGAPVFFTRLPPNV